MPTIEELQKLIIEICEIKIEFLEADEELVDTAGTQSELLDKCVKIFKEEVAKCQALKKSSKCSSKQKKNKN